MNKTISNKLFNHKFLLTLFILALLTFTIPAVQAMGPTDIQANTSPPTIDCDWNGAFVSCTVNEPQGIGSILIYRELNEEPLYSQLNSHPECPTTTSFSTHADGPSSLLIDVNPCGNLSKISNYVYMPMDTNSQQGKIKALKVPNNKSVDLSVEGLVEENKRLWRFMKLQKKEKGVVQEK